MAVVIHDWLIEFGHTRGGSAWFWTCLKCGERQVHDKFLAASMAASEHADSHSPVTSAGAPG